MTRPQADLRALTLALVLIAPIAGCERKAKRVLRTEPWPAPAVSASAGSAVIPGQPLRYEITSASVHIELPAKKAKPSGKFSNVKGTIKLDPVRLERTSAKLDVDLLSLSLWSAKNKDAEDPALLARAFDWLEVSAERGGEARELNRYATLELDGFEPPATREDDARTWRSGRVVAHGTLTLHHFRVPVVLELDVELGDKSGKNPDLLKIRTRKPLVVALAAHDILPRDERGTLLPKELTTLGSEVGREARISAELEARPAPRPTP